MKRSILVKYTFALCLVLFSGIAYPIDRIAPSFALFSTEGNIVKLSSEISKNDVLLVFFAGYCIPCRNEIPELVKLHSRYSDRFNIVYVNIDKEGKAVAEKTLSEIGIVNYICLLDMYQQTIKKYSSTLAIPAFFLIDKSGKIRYESIGYKSESLKSFEEYIITTNK